MAFRHLVSAVLFAMLTLNSVYAAPPGAVICPRPATEVTDVGTYKMLLSDSRVLARLSEAAKMGRLFDKVMCTNAGYNAEYIVAVKPKVAPPHGINGGGFFTVNVNGGGIAGSGPIITAVGELTLAR